MELIYFENSSSFILTCSVDTNNLAMTAKWTTETKEDTDKSIALHFKGGQQEAENTF